MQIKSVFKIYFLRLLFLMTATMLMLTESKTNAARERKKLFEINLTPNRTIGLVEAFNQHEFIAIATEMVPQYAKKELSLGVCEAMNQFRTLITNNDFSHFVKILRQPSFSPADLLIYKTAFAYLLESQNKVQVPQLDQEGDVQFNLRNGTRVKANSTRRMANILLNIEKQTANEIFFIGHGLKDWQVVMTTMQENIIYRLYYFLNRFGIGHTILLQKFDNFLLTFDSLAGTSVFAYRTNLQLLHYLSRYDHELNFLLMYQNRDISFAPLFPTIRKTESEIIRIFFLETTLSKGNLAFANVLEYMQALPDLNKSDWGKFDPLLISTTFNNRPESVLWLLNHRCNANTTVLNRALYIAADLGYIETAKILKDHGADPNRSLPGYGTALIRAIQGKNLALVQMLADDVDLNQMQAYDSHTPLMWAVYKQSAEIVEELCKRGANPRVITPKGETALTVALAHKVSKVIIQILLDYGADGRVNLNNFPDLDPKVVTLIKSWAPAFKATEEFVISP